VRTLQAQIVDFAIRPTPYLLEENPDSRRKHVPRAGDREGGGRCAAMDDHGASHGRGLLQHVFDGSIRKHQCASAAQHKNRFGCLGFEGEVHRRRRRFGHTGDCAGQSEAE